MKKIAVIILVIALVAVGVLAAPDIAQWQWLLRHGRDAITVDRIEIASSNIMWTGFTPTGLAVGLAVQVRNSSPYEVEIDRLNYSLWLGGHLLVSDVVEGVYLQPNGLTRIPVSVELGTMDIVGLAFQSVSYDMEASITGSMVIPVKILGIRITSVRIPLEFSQPVDDETGYDTGTELLDPYVQVRLVDLPQPSLRVERIETTGPVSLVTWLQMQEPQVYWVELPEFDLGVIARLDQSIQIEAPYLKDLDQLVFIELIDLEIGDIRVISGVDDVIKIGP